MRHSSKYSTVLGDSLALETLRRRAGRDRGGQGRRRLGVLGAGCGGVTRGGGCCSGGGGGGGGGGGWKEVTSGEDTVIARAMSGAMTPQEYEASEATLRKAFLRGMRGSI